MYSWDYKIKQSWIWRSKKIIINLVRGIKDTIEIEKKKEILKYLDEKYLSYISQIPGPRFFNIKFLAKFRHTIFLI